MSTSSKALCGSRGIDPRTSRLCLAQSCVRLSLAGETGCLPMLGVLRGAISLGVGKCVFKKASKPPGETHENRLTWLPPLLGFTNTSKGFMRGEEIGFITKGRPLFS